MKRLLLFVLKFLAVFFILVFSAKPSGTENGYRSFYIGVAEFLFSEMAVDGKVYFQEYNQANEREFDIEAGLLSDRYIKQIKKEQRKQNRKVKNKKPLEIRPFSSRYDSSAMGMLPSIFIVSLVIAAGLPLKRSIFSLILSLLIYHLLSFAVFNLCLLNDFQTTSEIIQYDKNSFMDKFIRFSFRHFPTRLDILFGLAFIIWLVCSFTKEDIKRLRWDRQN